MNEETIYKELGRSVVLFQYLESLIYQISHFLLDVNRRQSSRIALDALSFAKLRDVSEVILAEVLQEQNVEDFESLIDRYHRLMQEARELGNIRNKLVHSAYLHLESSGELWKIVRISASLKTKGKPHRKIEHDDLDDNSFSDFQKKCAKLYFSLGQFKTQLFHIVHRG